MSALSNLNNALIFNNQAYGGATNAAKQQYQQNAGAVNQNLINSGLGNTTVAQTMQQAPLQTYNNSLLNILGQKQGAAANIYGQAANIAANQEDMAMQAQLQREAMVPPGGVGPMGGLPTIQEGAQAPAATASALGGLVNLNNAMNSSIASAPYTPSQADIDEDATAPVAGTPSIPTSGMGGEIPGQYGGTTGTAMIQASDPINLSLDPALPQFAITTGMED